MALMTCDSHIVDPHAAKHNTIIHGLQLARNIGINRLVVEGDSLSTIQAIQSEEDNFSWLGTRMARGENPPPD
jgi:ribonuclease HI